MIFLLLAAITLIILFLSYKIWIKTKEISFLLGFALMYYWTFLGSWFLAYDEISGQAGKALGLHYYYLLDKMFPVHADNTYMISIALYALFFFCVQITILYFAKKRDRLTENAGFISLRINHFQLMIITCILVIISCIFVWKEILTAAKFEQSVYNVTRTQPGKYFTLHQLLNEAAVVSIYIGLIAYISGEKGKYISSVPRKSILIGYILTVFFVEGYMLLLGNKKEIFFAGIMAFIFYMNNVGYKFKIKSLLLLGAVIITPLFFNDSLRHMSPTFLANYFDTTGLEYNPEIDKASGDFSMSDAATAFLFSNEMFCANFSMYGSITLSIPFTYGTSLVSLGTSVVPHIFWPNRPGTIYEHYVQYVNPHTHQGFTIHHATAWYLNFGVIGIILGAFILGLIWVYFYNKFISLEGVKRKFMRFIFILGPGIMVAQLPTIIRGGPESYKSLVFEGFLIPVLVIFFATIDRKNIFKKKNG